MLAGMRNWATAGIPAGVDDWVPGGAGERVLARIGDRAPAGSGDRGKGKSEREREREPAANFLFGEYVEETKKNWPPRPKIKQRRPKKNSGGQKKNELGQKRVQTPLQSSAKVLANFLKHFFFDGQVI